MVSKYTTSGKDFDALLGMQQQKIAYAYKLNKAITDREKTISKLQMLIEKP